MWAANELDSCELQAAMSCELGAPASQYELLLWAGALYYALFFELRRAASVKTVELGSVSCYYIYIIIIIKKNKPHFIIPQNVDFVNRVLQAGIKKEDNCLQPIFILLGRGRTYVLLCELSTILTSQWLGLKLLEELRCFSTY